MRQRRDRDGDVRNFYLQPPYMFPPHHLTLCSRPFFFHNHRANNQDPTVPPALPTPSPKGSCTIYFFATISNPLGLRQNLPLQPFVLLLSIQKRRFMRALILPHMQRTQPVSDYTCRSSSSLSRIAGSRIPMKYA